MQTGLGAQENSITSIVRLLNNLSILLDNRGTGNTTLIHEGINNYDRPHIMISHVKSDTLNNKFTKEFTFNDLIHREDKIRGLGELPVVIDSGAVGYLIKVINRYLMNFVSSGKRVYISSPYTNGNRQQNVRLQMQIAEKLIKFGFYPYTPLLSHFLDIFSDSIPERTWLDIDVEYVKICGALLRIKPMENGKEIISHGADEEEATALKNNIPVFYSIESLLNFYDKK